MGLLYLMALLKASRRMLPVFSMKDILESSSSPPAVAAPSRDGSRSKLIAIERRVPEKDRTNGMMVGVDLSRASIHFLQPRSVMEVMDAGTHGRQTWSRIRFCALSEDLNL